MFLSKSRSGVYHLFFKDEAGRRHSRSTGARTKAEAIQFVRAFNAEEDARRRAMQQVTLEEFTEILLSHSKSIHTPSTVAAHRTALSEFSRVAGKKTVLSRILPTDCERFLAKKTVEASVWTARKYYLALGAAFERAKGWGHIMDNPWRKVKKPRVPEKIPLYFTREQLRTLLESIVDRDFRELVMVAAFTGLRLGELLAMEWDWVDLPQRLLTVKNTKHFTTKSKRVRLVPLSDAVVAVLLARRERSNQEAGIVFTMNGRSMSREYVSHRFKEAIRKTDLPEDLHFHSLRHSFASLLVQGGVSLFQVGKLLGHSSTCVTEIYAHLVLQDMHGVLGPLHLDS